MLQERKFCSDAHQEQHHQLLLACLTGEPDAAAEREPGPPAAGFVAELVGLANAVAEPLSGLALPFSCSAAFEPTGVGMCVPLALPAADLIPIRARHLDGCAEPAPTAVTLRCSKALPLLNMRASASRLRRGLLLASTVRLEPRAVETSAEPARAGSARSFALVGPLFESAAGHRRRVIEAPQSLRDSPPKAGLIALMVDCLSGPATPVRCAPLVIAAVQLFPRLQLAPRGKAWDGAAALPVGVREASEIFPAPLPFTMSRAARAFSAQDLRLPASQAIPHAARAPIPRGLRADTPRYALGAGTPMTALVIAWALLPNTPTLGPLSPVLNPLKPTRPELAKLQAAALPVQFSPEQPRFTPDNRWRVRLIIRRPLRESWKSPIPPEPTAEGRLMRPVPVPKPTLWVKLAHRRSAKAPTRAAVLAVLLMGAGIVLWTPATPVIHQARETIRAYLRERSEILIEDYFLSGVSGWEGGPESASGWIHGAAGFVQPKKLALLTASLPLADYRLEFLGQIEQKSLSWVFRATDLNNFYAMKITIARPGPLPLCAIVRYTVVDGVAVDRFEVPLSLSIRNDSLYHVETSVQQDRFITSINGQVVDTFYDRRHPSGGVGLFSGPGESSRILWVRVAEQDDLLGRLCAYFSRDSVDRKAAFLPIARKRKAVTE